MFNRKSKPKTTKLTHEDYLRRFGGRPARRPAVNRASRALEQALTVRQFEIQLYWTRARYFWAFNAAALAAFGLTVTTQRQTPEILFIQYLVICLGTVLSVAWYFVNRGSKYWQINWEQHVSGLQHRFLGPLFEITLTKKWYRFFDLLAEFHFSVTKINHVTNLFFIAIWIYLGARHLAKYGNLGNFEEDFNPDLAWPTLFVVLAVIGFFIFGRAKKKPFSLDVETFVGP